MRVRVKKPLLRRFKRLLTVLGARMPAPTLHRLQMVLNYMRLGRWMARNGFHVRRRLAGRSAVLAAVAERVRARRVLYLEFGVFRGATIRYWSSVLEHPDSRLHGFDSFRGLPEDFDAEGPYVRGSFDVQGRVPEIDDERVEFFRGWFEEVLPGYRVPEHDVLVMVLDADLYSSTRCVLQHLGPHLRPGSYVYFDDMSRPDHEPRAFEEFIAESGRVFRVVAADHSLNYLFFECVG